MEMLEKEGRRKNDERRGEEVSLGCEENVT